MLAMIFESRSVRPIAIKVCWRAAIRVVHDARLRLAPGDIRVDSLANAPGVRLCASCAVAMQNNRGLDRDKDGIPYRDGLKDPPGSAR